MLEGTPALAVAVDRRVRVALAPIPGPACRVSSAPLPSQPCEFRITSDNGLRWLGDGGGAETFNLLSVVVEHLSSNPGLPGLSDRSFSVQLDSTNLFHNSGYHASPKLGLGSSAALTVALSHALVEFAGSSGMTIAQWLPVLVNAHRAFQSGRGSGIDIAASLYGGAITYELGDDGPTVGSAVLPAGLIYRFIWTGKPASTAVLLRELSAWREKNPMIYNRLMAQMGSVSAAAIAAAGAADCTHFIDAVGEYARNLDSLGRQADIEIFSAPHRELYALAFGSGLVYKPCGAGGGDLGVVMGVCSDDVDRFAAQAEKSGYPPVDISTDPEGVRTIRSF